MTHPDSSTDSEARLTAFLQAHRTPVPPPALDLEDRIMAMINVPAVAPLSKLANRSISDETRRRVLWWAAPPAIAASLLVGWFGYQTAFAPPTLSPEEVADLENFIENTWDGTVNRGTGLEEFSLSVPANVHSES